MQTVPSSDEVEEQIGDRPWALPAIAVVAIVGACALLLTMAVSLFSPNETTFELNPGTDPDVIYLPPTSGVISVRFDPATNVDVSPGWQLSMGDPSIIERCDQGCRVRFSQVDDQIPTQVTITYLAGNSEYVNDIEDSYIGSDG